MGVERFEILVRDNTTKYELKREWSKPEIMKSLAWLKRMNARGCEVLVRPAKQHGLVLIDALTAGHLATMHRKGFEPSVVIESKPDVYQAWIVVSARPITDQVRQLAVEGFVRSVGAVVPDSEAKDFGYLAGFTCYDQRDPVGKRRFVLAHYGDMTVASSGERLLGMIEKLRDVTGKHLKRSEEQERQNRGRSR